MALLHIAYERLLTRDPQRGDDRALRRGGPPPRTAALRGPLVRPAGADAARRAAALGRARGRRRGRARAAARRRPDDPRHARRRAELRPRAPEHGAKRHRVHGNRPHRAARRQDQRHHGRADGCSRGSGTSCEPRALGRARRCDGSRTRCGQFLHADDAELLPYDLQATLLHARPPARGGHPRRRGARRGDREARGDRGDRRPQTRTFTPRSSGSSARSDARSTRAARATTRSPPRSVST